MPGTHPIRVGAALDEPTFHNIRSCMELDHCKWDAQVGDVTTLARFPLLIRRSTWQGLAGLAERLTEELPAAEQELVSRPSLQKRLAVPRRLRELFARAGATPAAARVMRFDFHWTTEGWRISEVNSDVPGGYTEATNFAALVAAHTPGSQLSGDPTRRIVGCLARAASNQVVALLCASGYMEDHQVVMHLARRLRERGLTAHIAAPHQLRWRDGCAQLSTRFYEGPAGAIFRFYQSEWLARLRCDQSWEPLFVGAKTKVANPGLAVLSESKRLPLAWNDLAAPMTTFKKLLPETRAPSDAPWRTDEGWLLKSAYCNTGDSVSIRSAMTNLEWARLQWKVRICPNQWIAQRRFIVDPVASEQGPLHACVGVYTIDGEAAGCYGRITEKPIIDGNAVDVALLIEEDTP
jgi:glutathionylspermidine synthase